MYKLYPRAVQAKTRELSMKRLTEKKKNIVAVVLILAAAALIVTGVVLGQERSVLTKAIRICMECVGIG